MPNSSLEVSHSAGFPLGAAHCSDIFSSGVVCLRADALRYPVRFAVSTCSSRVASADPAIYLTSLCLALATGLSLGFASRSLASGEKITHPSRPTFRGGSVLAKPQVSGLSADLGREESILAPPEPRLAGRLPGGRTGCEAWMQSEGGRVDRCGRPGVHEWSG